MIYHLYMFKFFKSFIFLILHKFQEFFFYNKSPSAKAKGLEWSGSPDRAIDRTFTSMFYFPHKVPKPKKITRIYRNPIYSVREYMQKIESGKFKNQLELAQLKDISRTRIRQILNLLKLDKNIITRLKIIGDPMERRIVSERQLRNLTKNY